MSHISESDFARYPRYGWSTRQDGTMLVALDGEIYLPGEQNREKFFKTNKIAHYVVCGLAHGVRIRTVSLVDDKTITYDFDGLVTSSPNLFLCLTIADCFPVYFWNKNNSVVGLAHAGWRGVAGSIVSKMVVKINSEFACGSENLMAAIGPGIRQCHFEVNEDVASQFAIFPECAETRDGQTYIDLASIIKRQLIGVGIRKENIADCDECTYCLPNKYFSRRRDKTEPLDAMLVYIGIAP